MPPRDPLDDPHVRARAILSVASVSWIMLCLPVSVGTAVSWLAQKDMEHARPVAHWLANLWFAVGSLFIPLTVMSILSGWRLHRSQDDRRALQVMFLPVAGLLLFVGLGAIVVLQAR